MSTCNCLVPTHVLEKMMENGKEHTKKWALSTMLQGSRLRGAREVLGDYRVSNKNLGKKRIIQSANNTSILKGNTVRQEGDESTGIEAIDEAYDYSGILYDFYFEEYKRNSLDGRGMRLLSTVNYGSEFNNAFWNGERMVYGDGDGEYFNRFTRCLEVVGHELTHGVITSSLNLEYRNQAGSLNEAIADVFGLLALQRYKGHTAEQATWIVGEGLFTNKINGLGIRNIKNPGFAYNDEVLGKDPCPAKMSDFVETKENRGGVHINCTIPSHAFYISAVNLGGNAWERLGKVWYNTLTKRLKNRSANFEEWANLTLIVAGRLYGKNSNVFRAVEKGWKDTEVL